MTLYVRFATPNPQEAAKSRLAGSSVTLWLADVQVEFLRGECACAPVEWRACSYAAADSDLQMIR